MIFAHELRAWRASLGADVPQEVAAEILGVPLATYRNYEQGRTKPQHVDVLRLALAEAARRWRKRLPAHA